ncbi:MAG: polyamine ABC transporter substrate-binding protein [Bosea sp.]|uniref:polyamine ABC transporter substrate-binding protein n=1 Tax=Bosea sp. (in: a-proteobacteria) TaxID=1871050 RepID=UPI001AD00106|nr:polyamine ABC transporter substrate-binding protein [Bosea sp. (in: a-proteobacteria)]MBN9467213.1 polyamine ABC transporter substrate-binding protein [Bosea sp. (in: a-proteobacteria)]
MKFVAHALAAVALAATAGHVAPAAAQQTLTISSWGGAYQKAQREAWFNIVEKELGVTIKEETTSGVADVRAQVASGRPTWDLVQQGNYGCALLDKEGNTEPLTPAILGVKGIADNMKGKGWISNLVYATTLAWSDEKYRDKKPSSWADMWDTKTFPGGRTMRRSPVYALESALLADGVPMEKLYPLDTARAFKKLEAIKKDVVVWWASGAQSQQVLKDREVEMAAIWNGRAAALATEGEKVSLTFNQQMLLTDCWVVPKGAKNKDLAMKAIEIMSRPEVQARIALYINYGPANVEAFNTGIIKPEVAAKLPSSPENAKKGFVLDANYWAANLDELTKQFDLFIQR